MLFGILNDRSQDGSFRETGVFWPSILEMRHAHLSVYACSDGNMVTTPASSLDKFTQDY